MNEHMSGPGPHYDPAYDLHQSGHAVPLSEPAPDWEQEMRRIHGSRVSSTVLAWVLLGVVCVSVFIAMFLADQIDRSRTELSVSRERVTMMQRMCPAYTTYRNQTGPSQWSHQWEVWCYGATPAKGESK